MFSFISFLAKNKNKIEKCKDSKNKREWLIPILKWLVNNKIPMMKPTERDDLVIGFIDLAEIYQEEELLNKQMIP